MPEGHKDNSSDKRLAQPVYWQAFSVSVLFHFIYCIIASESLLGFPIAGGTLYLFGRMAVLFTGMQRPPRSRVLSRKEKILSWGILMVPLLLLPVVLSVLPIRLTDRSLWVMSAIALMLTLRMTLTGYLVEKDLMQTRPVRSAFSRMIVTEGLFLLPLIVMVILCADGRTALSLSGGALLGTIVECQELWRERRVLRATAPDDEKEIETLRHVMAYRRFQFLTVVTAAALQVTMAFEYALVAALSDTVLAAMAMAAVLLAAVLLTDLIHRRVLRERSDPGNVLIMGSAIWFYGVIWYVRVFDTMVRGDAFIALALSAVGGAICIRTLGYMDTRMRDVASFVTHHPPTRAYDWALRTRVELSSLVGQAVSLAGLMLLDIFAAGRLPDTLPALVDRLRPVMTMPALILTLLALVASIRFPLTGEHMAKLDRYMRLSGKGERNRALESQLETAIVKKSLKHFGIRIVIHILRPLYYHRVVGRDRVHMDPQGAAVFVCNHGEISGPVTATLFVPWSVRPWVTHQMADKNEIAEYLYTTNFSHQKWIPERLKKGLAYRFAGPILAWMIGSLEPIPVYISDPARLRETFRETVSAMEAGDNILLFPENSATSEDHHYVREGVSDFFTGFAMIGRLYYRRTGLECQFIPVYCDKKKRTVTFGESVRYDPSALPTDEAERISTVLRDRIRELAGGPSSEQDG